MSPQSLTSEQSLRSWDVHRFDPGGDQFISDVVVIEEPLEMRVSYGPSKQRNEMALSITMRTPGDDIALTTGFILTEGIVRTIRDVESVEQVSENVIRVSLSPDFIFTPASVQRHFYTSSSCGICGKASIDMVRQVGAYRLLAGQPTVTFTALQEMGEKLRTGQPIFAATGGIHATALFTAEGELLCIKEDIGRHNAMDKMIGWAATHKLLPLSRHIIIVSGRGGFELVQKSLAAGVAIFAAVGAPSSLALELAKESDMTVAGFLRNDRVNVYTHPERVISNR